MKIYKSLIGALILTLVFTFSVTSVMSQSPVTPPVTPPQSPTPTPSIVYQWVSFGPLGKPKADWDTAEEFLAFFNRNKVKALEVDRWINGGWDAHIYQLPFNNFSISEGNGYFVKVDQLSLAKMLKLLGYENVKYLQYRLTSGWNYVSIPQKMMNSLGKTNSEDICKSVSGQGGNVQTVAQWKSGRSKDDWKEYTCGSKIGKFQIKAGQGYMIRMSNSITWEPVKQH